MQKAIFFPAFMRALDDKAPIIIISSRGHNQRDFRSLLSKAAALGGRRLHAGVLGKCVNNPALRRRYPLDLRVPDLKVRVLQDFVQSLPATWQVGYSDDDASNLAAMRKALAGGMALKRRVSLFDGITGEQERL